MSRRTLLMLIAGLASFVLLLFMLDGSADGADPEDPEASAFSTSAIGHHAFAELLAELDYPVVRSRFESGDRAAWSAILVVAEPDLATSRSRHDLERMLARSSSALIVLPKWAASYEGERHYVLRPARVPERVLELLRLDARLVRLPEGSDAAEWTRNELGVIPELQNPQLVRSEWLEPLVSCAEGTLLGQAHVRGTDVLVLSDPDIISNVGLARSDNALFALRALAALGPSPSPVLFDEVLHGYRAPPSLLGALTSFPLAIVTLQVLLGIGLLIWSGTLRFGRPIPAPKALEAGKRGLIDNIAALHLYLGQRVAVLGRYLDGTLREIAETFDTAFDDAGQPDLEALEELSRSRGCRLSPQSLAREVSALGGRSHAHSPAESAKVIEAAHRIHQWKEEIIHGSRAAS